MVKVIGEVPEAIKQATCHNCAARLEYVNADVKKYCGKDYGGGSSVREWIDCPRCGHEVTLRSW